MAPFVPVPVAFSYPYAGLPRSSESKENQHRSPGIGVIVVFSLPGSTAANAGSSV